MTTDAALPLWAYQLGLLTALVGSVGYLVFIDRSKGHPWKFADMLMTFKDGAPIADRQAYMLLGGWYVLTAWGTYWIFTTKSLPEWFVAVYAAYCVGSYGYSRHLKYKAPEKKGAE